MKSNNNIEYSTVRRHARKHRAELASYLRLIRRGAIVELDKDDRDLIKNKAKSLLEETGVEELTHEIIDNLGLELDNGSDKATQEKKVGITVAGLFIGASLLMIASTSQAAFDLAVAGRAVFDPVIALVTDHFGKGVVAVGGVGALVTPGADLRTKAIGFGIGAAAAGLAMLAVRAGFGI